ncbi:hypothetical protein [Novosphingobium colocasiae]|uniref:Uncharacterized protein n=1 Tax=Novosphingobium colocasiae TaxID=1256513 RepID=A0A918PAC6_9SPHN|nr:hypothetical protein [Novosphingobium colocasiae]GGY93985.1 hypothetical protein GCM10011614_06210 [Novosphingobium colocasiae]
MNLTRDRVYSIGWATILLVCFVLTVALTLRVNAVKSQVHQADKRIVAVQQDIAFLETEFQTRSNQQQLKLLNDVEFGYGAPTAEQYLEGERQLLALGKAVGPNAPAPLLYAHDDGSAAPEKDTGNSLLAMVSPVTGASAAAATVNGPEAAERRKLARDAANLSQRLARIELPQASQQ